MNSAVRLQGYCINTSSGKMHNVPIYPARFLQVTTTTLVQQFSLEYLAGSTLWCLLLTDVSSVFIPPFLVI